MRGPEPLKELFWSELNYDRINQPLSRRGWSQTANSALAEDPVLFAGGGQSNDFHVIYSRLASDSLRLSHERPIVTQLLKGHEYALFIFSNLTQDRWHFINVKYEADTKRRRLFRRITVSPEERLRTAAERLALIDVEAMSDDLFGLSPLAVQQRHDDAFDVEAVTDQFFKEYKNVFRFLEDYLTEKTDAKEWAHDYSLQFLNRCMFLYFIQRKGWLGNDRDFLMSFWKGYQRSGQPEDTFVEGWLKVLFFEAFNNRFHGGHGHLPDEIRDALSLAPYLNGGLFTENKLDHEHSLTISDSCFEKTLKFLERYNFTISEDSPLDKEVAVDPEMIGKVYESLINISDDVDARGEAGIFYTPRTEIDLMCRLALVDHLSNHLGQEHKGLLNQLAFSLEPDEKPETDEAVARAGLWPALKERLHDITVLDPACGSGSFLVGMLNILDDLQERADRQLGVAEPSYDRKKRIIGQSLYGVDVMEWACHVAELRLWLALIIDADFTREELHVRREPLLPHFSFKIRCGDSLVQEVGGINLGHIAVSQEIPSTLKARITSLKNEKLKFYNNDTTCQFHSVDALKNEEKRLFSDILDARQHRIQERIKSLRRKLEGPQESQIRLDGTVTSRSHQVELEANRYRQEIETLTAELVHVEAARKALGSSGEMPFVWDIAFVEIFEGENEGFDIVIGNPPYVERHKIRDPNGSPGEGIADRKRYMSKLARSVCEAFPVYFGLRSGGQAARLVSAMSDLYIYFYFHGLSLLNRTGAFCFITSNTWLDVGYGADLQEFLLKHCHVKLVLDNQVKRTFTNADVNSIIVLFSAPDDRHQWALEETARFVMFRVPFEHILSAVIFDEIGEASERRVTEEYRIFPVQQGKLLDDGCEPSRDNETGQVAGQLIRTERYTGSKWGGKYLRGPDIYHVIAERGGMVPLQRYAKARLGVTTGANEFFFVKRVSTDTYVTGVGGIQREIAFPDAFARPVVRTVTECRDMTVRSGSTQWRIAVLPEDIHDSRALDYVQLAEHIGIPQRPFFKARRCWYSLSSLPDDIIAVPEIVFARYFFLWNEDSCILNKNFYGFIPKAVAPQLLWGLLNSSFSFLQFELSSRKPGAGASGIGVGVANTMLVLSIDQIGANERSLLESAGVRMREMPIRDVRCDLLSQERRNIDDIIFEVIGLTQGERDAVYEAVINLVEARLKKAGSV